MSAVKTPGGFSLKRWSRRKLAAARELAQTDAGSPVTPVSAPDETVPVATAPAMPAVTGPPNAPVLPPVESLTHDSDFTAYLQPQVDESVKRLALKKLFTDPRFNVMDGLDVYIDDYTKTVPIPPDVLERLMQARFSFNPPLVPGEELQASEKKSSIEHAPAAPALTAEPAAATLPAVDDTAAPAARDEALRVTDRSDDPSGIAYPPEPTSTR